jgi:gamma-glutamyltranspeptidase/glutathione hydrolase
MTVQQATEAANFNTNQLWLSLGGTKMADRKPRAGNILLSSLTPDAVRNELKKMGYKTTVGERTSGPINAIHLDTKHKSIWGGSSNNGEDYGIGW